MQYKHPVVMENADSVDLLKIDLDGQFRQFIRTLECHWPKCHYCKHVSHTLFTFFLFLTKFGHSCQKQ